MTATKKLLLLCCLLFAYEASQAQIEVAYLNAKNFSAIGFGAFLNLSIPVTEKDAVTAEAAAQVFRKDNHGVAIVPFLLGYRHILDESGYGFYVEPLAGYTIGGTDLQKTDATGSIIYNNGQEVDQKARGITAGFGAGYLFQGNSPFNLSLRIQHVFVSGDPSLNTISLRLSHPLWRRRDN